MLYLNSVVITCFDQQPPSPKSRATTKELRTQWLEITEPLSHSVLIKTVLSDWGDGSVGQALGTHAQGPEFRFPEPHKSWMWECVYNLSTPMGRGEVDQKAP